MATQLDRWIMVNPIHGKVVVNPVLKKCDFVDRVEQGQIFHRKKLQGKMMFINNDEKGINDYSRLKELEESVYQCSQVEIFHEVYCEGSWEYEWKGYFSLLSGKWDDNKCSFECKVKTLDRYSYILRNNEVEEQIELAALQQKEMRFFEGELRKKVIKIGVVYERITSELTEENIKDWIEQYWDDHVAPFTDLTYLEFKYEWTIYGLYLYQESSTQTNVDNEEEQLWQVMKFYVAQEKKTGVPAGDDCGWRQSTFELGTWVRDIPCNLDGNYFAYKTQKRYHNFNYFGNDYYSVYKSRLPLMRTSTSDGSVPPIYRAYSFSELINRVVTVCVGNHNIVSNFFDINPDGLGGGYNRAYDNDIGTDNLYFLQMSDVKEVLQMFKTGSSYYLHPARKAETAYDGEMTFKRFMDGLKEMFNVYWDIDDDGKLRIEHVSYYLNIAGFDLTKPANKKFLRGRSNYSYVDDSFPRGLRLKFQDESDKETEKVFDSEPIRYHKDCLDPDADVITNSARDINTNVEYFFTDDVNNIQLNGILLFEILENRNKSIRRRENKVNGRCTMNERLTGYAMYEFMLNQRLHFKDVRYLDSVPLETYNVKHSKSMDVVEISGLCCQDYYAMDFNKMVKTQYGWCYVEQAKYDKFKQMLTLKLLAK